MVEIRPLDWHEAEDGGVYAFSVLTGHHKVVESYGSFIAIGLGPYPSEQMAKDACFQRHERAIMSQLEVL